MDKSNIPGVAIGGLIGAAGLAYLFGPLAGVLGAILGGFGGNMVSEAMKKAGRDMVAGVGVKSPQEAISNLRQRMAIPRVEPV